MSKKYVYLFAEGNGKMKELLGGKGANLAEMTNLGMPVPRGFTVSTEACTQYYEDGELISQEIQDEIMKNVATLEEQTGKKFGDKENPLLVSVPFRRARIHAGHDGHGFKSWPQRGRRRGYGSEIQ